MSIAAIIGSVSVLHLSGRRNVSRHTPQPVDKVAVSHVGCGTYSLDVSLTFLTEEVFDQSAFIEYMMDYKRRDAPETVKEN